MAVTPVPTVTFTVIFFKYPSGPYVPYEGAGRALFYLFFIG